MVLIQGNSLIMGQSWTQNMTIYPKYSTKISIITVIQGVLLEKFKAVFALYIKTIWLIPIILG